MLPMELDHLFILTDPGAPQAERLINFGLREAPPNVHPGQGTANRRFYFVNAMIELLWVSDPLEAQSEATRRTLLWERWNARDDASPFGFCLRPSDPQHAEPPFPAQEYRPSFLPAPLCIHIAETDIEEPMWFHMNFLRRAAREEQFEPHPAGLREITALALAAPNLPSSPAAVRARDAGIISYRQGLRHVLEVQFDRGRAQGTIDFRPHLPLIFLW